MFPRPDWPRRDMRFWTFAAIILTLALVLLISLVVALGHLIGSKPPRPTGTINALVSLFATCLFVALVGLLVLFFGAPDPPGEDGGVPDPEAQRGPPPPPPGFPPRDGAGAGAGGAGPAGPRAQPPDRGADQPVGLQPPPPSHPRTWRPGPPYLQTPTRLSSPRELPGDPQPTRRGRAAPGPGWPGLATQEGSPDRRQPPEEAGQQDHQHQHRHQQPEHRRGSDSGYGMSSPEHATCPVSPLSPSPSPSPSPQGPEARPEEDAAAEHPGRRADAEYDLVWRALFPRLMGTIREETPSPPSAGSPPAPAPAAAAAVAAAAAAAGRSRRRTSSVEPPPLASFAERAADHEKRRWRRQRQRRRSKSFRRRASYAGCGYS